MRYEEYTINNVLRNLAYIEVSEIISDMHMMMAGLGDAFVNMGTELASAFSGDTVEKPEINASEFFSEEFTETMDSVYEQLMGMPDEYFASYKAQIKESFTGNDGLIAFKKMEWISSELPQFTPLDKKVPHCELMAYVSLKANEPRFTEAFTEISKTFAPISKMINEDLN